MYSHWGGGVYEERDVKESGICQISPYIKCEYPSEQISILV